MQKHYLLLVSLFALLSGPSASAQCTPQPLNCPDTLEVCDLSHNNLHYWNQPVWWDAANQNRNLADAPADVSLFVRDTCGGSGIAAVRCLLFLDLDGDGTWDTVVDTDNPPDAGTVLFNNADQPNYIGGTPTWFDTRALPAAEKWRFTLSAAPSGDEVRFSLLWTALSGTHTLPELPYGQHRVRWEITDVAGTVQVCDNRLEIKDCQEPTVVCINGLSAHIMPTKKITLYASDFLLYADDNATPSNRIQIALRKQGAGAGFPVDSTGKAVTTLTFTCDELGVQGVEVWAKDAAGNLEVCETSVLIQDLMGQCPTPPNQRQLCASSFCSGIPVPNEVTWQINITPPGSPTTTYYAVSEPCTNIMPPADSDVTITPTKDSDPLNGVSQFDIALLRQYIQSGTLLPSPYLWIAADANNDQVIDSLDVIECQRLLLGLYVELPNNSSWRFVDKNYVFPWPNPLAQPFPESVTINSGSLPAAPIEFVAVKICDLSCPGLVSVLDPEAVPQQHVIGQPQPNPTRNGAALPIHLLHGETVLLEVLDLAGRLLFRTETPLPAGPALLEIPAAALPQAGAYVWRVRMGEAVKVGKVVRE